MRPSARRRARATIAASLVVALVVALAPPGSAGSSPRRELFGATASPRQVALPPRFTDRLAFARLNQPTVMQFAPDGRVFVGERPGGVKVFDSLTDRKATLVKDLSAEVYSADDSDRGLLGMALDPSFDTGQPYLYVLYTLDAPIGGSPPVFHDHCPDSIGVGCTVGARLSRFQVFGDDTSGPEQVLVEDWCQQYPSHSIGTLAFGPDGALYVGGGDGASFTFTDFGQVDNPCGDPVDEGGALRSQDERTQTDPTGLNGSILRVDPATGAALPDNPLVGGDASDDRIIAYGMRNPFRFVVKPGTDSIVVGDVGYNTWEEVDQIGSAADSTVENFGWPCYEGKPTQRDYKAADLQICKGLYAQPGSVTTPVLAINHGQGACDGSNVISGMAFYPGGTYPPQYVGALFFADIVRGCMWTMLPRPNGDPNPARWSMFATGITAVDIKPGPNGDLFYVNIYEGTIHRITFT